jgi:subtilisin family serine protease
MNSDPLSLLALEPLMAVSKGSSKISIGLIDGPVDLYHPAFQESTINGIDGSQISTCKNATSIACRHGTFVTGILAAKRGVSAPGICPGCRVILRPIFTDDTLTNNKNRYKDIPFPTSTQDELSEAIKEVVDAGAKIINLSLGSSTSSLITNTRLEESYDYARKSGTIIVAAAGNQGVMGNTSHLNSQWIIPVAGCDEAGVLDQQSNFGASIAYRGVMAPSTNITSTVSGEGFAKMSGTSFAAPFVTGTIALLWSLFVNATPMQLVHAIRSRPSKKNHRSVVPPLLNVAAVWHLLNSMVGH